MVDERSLLKNHRWAKVVRIPTEVCDTSHLKVLMAPGRGLFCAVAPGGFNFLALSHMDLPSKGGTPQFCNFHGERDYKPSTPGCFPNIWRQSHLLGSFFKVNHQTLWVFPAFSDPQTLTSAPNILFGSIPPEKYHFLNHQHVGFPKIFRYQKPFFTTRTSLCAIPQLLRAAQVRYVASGDYGLVYRVLRMVDSAKQQAGGRTFCLGGYIAPSIPGGGVKSMESC